MDDFERKHSAGTHTHSTPMLTGVFRNRQDAEAAYNDLVKHGYQKDDITLIMSEETRSRYFDHDDEARESNMGSKALEGTGAGSAAGGIIGAAAGILATVGTSIAIPGLGLLIAGPIAAGLAGAGAGGITGGLIGALVGAGIPKERAKRFEDEIKEGAIVIGVRPRSREHVAFFEDEWQTRSEEIYGE